ncbi:inositol monophosphatase family protein [Rhizobium sp. S153]|uniref:Inositol monophosphatase family protein n=1 Tax=Ciceribacter sichuanensis TaxID=2949647 RepID=A0ABT0V7J5_9HYPH|nr:inositol monophosphatase family protein [Ciceribacter sp. S153]MCM2401764.1 inositol monophosphatase family protein [Ciceribacter sp. S153]
MESLDIAALANLLQEAAETEVLPRFRNLGTDEVRMKSEAIDLVTEADEAAERVIRQRIEALMPEAVFIGEEAVAADPGLLGKIEDAELAVIVDPIDGTFNYAAGLPLFGVMLSVVRKGETVAGLIYDPMGNDWLLAEKGSGAWLCRPDGQQEQMAVAPSVPLSQMVGIAAVTYMEREAKRQTLANLADVRLFTSYRCSAHEYRAFAAGHLHFLQYRKLMPWDHLAGTLISAEAGAYVRKLDRTPYRPYDFEGGILVASDEASWNELREKIFNV